MAAKEELFQPQFPSLSMCLVIDARHGSRSEILRDIKACDLFETIVEAKSLDDGLRIITNHAIDACFIGPSVSRAAACSLVQQLTHNSMMKDCALIVILNSKEDDDVALLSAGCHQIIRFPCSKMKFSEGVVRGVITANLNSPWVGIMLNAERAGINLFEEPSAPLARVAAEDKLSSSGLNSLFPQVAGEMESVFTHIESGRYALDDQGNLNAEATAAISSLVNAMLAEHDLGARSTAVQEFLTTSFLQWFLDLKKGNQKQATNTLKKKLTAFFHNR